MNKRDETYSNIYSAGWADGKEVGYAKGYADALRACLAQTVVLEDPPLHIMSGERYKDMLWAHEANIFKAFNIDPSDWQAYKPLQYTCQHEYREYVGIMEQYKYCTKCDDKVRE